MGKEREEGGGMKRERNLKVCANHLLELQRRNILIKQLIVVQGHHWQAISMQAESEKVDWEGWEKKSQEKQEEEGEQKKEKQYEHQVQQLEEQEEGRSRSKRSRRKTTTTTRKKSLTTWSSASRSKPSW